MLNTYINSFAESIDFLEFNKFYVWIVFLHIFNTAIRRSVVDNENVKIFVSLFG